MRFGGVRPAGRAWERSKHSLFMHVPGLKVVAPSNAHDAKGCMIAAIRDGNPVIFVEHRLPLSQIREGMERALHPDEVSLKIVIYPQSWDEDRCSR